MSKKTPFPVVPSHDYTLGTIGSTVNGLKLMSDMLAGQLYGDKFTVPSMFVTDKDPTAPMYDGDLWINPNTSTLKYYYSGQWRTVVPQDIADRLARIEATLSPQGGN